MYENEIFAAQQPVTEESGKKPSYAASLVLGILSIVLGLLIPLAGEVLSIIGIVSANKHKNTHNVKAGKICSIIGLIVSVANHVLGMILLMS